jgi:P-type Ca2+ transporter type 2C
VTGIANPKEEPILTPVQLLWVNLIMDTFAALALATDPPGPSILQRKPDPKSARLITLSMWKMIIGQAIYQLVVTLVLNFKGNEILGYETEYDQSRLETLIFNIYVWMQIFNQLK